MTLAELAAIIAVLAALGLVASRFGLSAIPAYLVAGILLGPFDPKIVTLIEPSEVTEFAAEIGVVTLLFFLGLEFSIDRVVATSRHIGIGGAIDLAINFGLGLVVGLAAFGPSVAALVVAAAVYVSSSAVTVKGLIDFRRLADEETDLVLAILVAEDLAIAFMLGFAGGAGGDIGPTLALLGKALGFIGLAVAASRWLPPLVDRFLDRLPREFFLLGVFAFLVGMAALGEELGLSEAIGALLAGIVLANTRARDEIEERFFSIRDLFGALFFFVFGLSIDLSALGSVGWMLALAVPLTILGKSVGGYLAGRVGGFGSRRSLNAGLALVAHGEFTIILAQVAAQNPGVDEAAKADLVAFAGLYVLATATIGVLLMKESKRIGRTLFPPRKLTREGVS
jgi:monovalent cation:H+ antiporter-2, CPA2 family